MMQVLIIEGAEVVRLQRGGRAEGRISLLASQWYEVEVQTYQHTSKTSGQIFLSYRLPGDSDGCSTGSCGGWNEVRARPRASVVPVEPPPLPAPARAVPRDDDDM